MWLINLVENLLSVTRIENGTMDLQMQPELLEEVFQEALAPSGPQARRNITISVELEDDLLMAQYGRPADCAGGHQHCEQRHQVHARRAPTSSRPPRREGTTWCRCEIADDGPGIPDEAKAEHL